MLLVAEKHNRETKQAPLYDLDEKKYYETISMNYYGLNQGYQKTNSKCNLLKFASCIIYSC